MNFPNGMSSRDWDHVEGRHLDECSECGRALAEHQDGEPCKPFLNLLRPRRRPFEESSPNYRQQMRDAGRGGLLGG